jgi:galactonate dehydratase
MERFADLCRTKAVDIIMPDVKHCGGILEGRNISAMAGMEGVKVLPHNPSGPVATAASARWCASISTSMCSSISGMKYFGVETW